jgi:two-component system, NtrC family, sensor kinase
MQVPGFPIYISLGVSKSAILGRWYASLVVYGAAALAASVALLSVSWIAARQAKAEQAALAQLNAETEKRLEAERRLHAAQRMEAVGQLTAGMAHDFNNLLAVILGSLDLLTGTEDRDRVLQLAERARRAGERGARLVSSLLTFAGKQALQVQFTVLNVQLSNFFPRIKQSVGEAIRVELMLDPAQADCHVDISQLEAALLHLAMNAKDAMPEGGALIITRNTLAAEDQSGTNPGSAVGPWVAVTFQDTGSGMTAEVRERIFEPFFTTKGVGAGSGLGLSQVLGFIRQVGGRVTVDSKLGCGTTVTLYFVQVGRGVRSAAPSPASGPQR